MTKQTKITTGILAGAALGAVIVLVLTADKNGDLKQKANDWFCNLLDSSKDKFSGIGNILKDKLAKASA